MKKLFHNLFLSFDVESVGLHGEAFAVGLYAFDIDHPRYEPSLAGHWACPAVHAAGTPEALAWVQQHTHYPPDACTCAVPGEVRRAFIDTWQRYHRQGYALLADCAYPVETNFLRACVLQEPSRELPPVYPLYDVASALLGRGFPPVAFYPRLPEELPPHDASRDALQSGRIFYHAVHAESFADFCHRVNYNPA